MGAVKSSFAATEYMLYHIERQEYDKITALLDKHPELLESSITKKTKMTPLYRACFNGNLEMTQFFVQKCGANVNTVTEIGQTALMVAVRRNQIELVRYLLARGANVNVTTPVGINSLEFAILPGFYQIAQLIYQKMDDKITRSEVEYFDMAETYKYRYVDFHIFLDNLEKGTNVENVPDFLTKPVKVYHDPVVDPRETWRQWTMRQLEFKDPPLVERQDLPEEYQPQNRRFGKLRTYMSNLTMSPLTHTKLHYHPKDYKSDAPAMSENELKNAPITGSQLQAPTSSIN